MNPQQKRAIAALHAVARPIILRRFRPDSCIASTRIGQMALAEFGVQAGALSVEVTLINRPYAEVWSRLGRDPKADELPDDAYALALGHEREGVDDDDTYNGHVVLTAGRYMVDLSIDQASRPQYGIQVRPLLAQMPSGWWRGRDPQISYSANAILVYVARADKRGFVEGDNWTSLNLLRPTVREVVAAMREHMR